MSVYLLIYVYNILRTTVKTNKLGKMSKILIVTYKVRAKKLYLLYLYLILDLLVKFEIFLFNALLREKT